MNPATHTVNFELMVDLKVNQSIVIVPAIHVAAASRKMYIKAGSNRARVIRIYSQTAVYLWCTLYTHNGVRVFVLCVPAGDEKESDIP